MISRRDGLSRDRTVRGAAGKDQRARHRAKSAHGGAA
jgi:hypothetical protein